MFFNKKNPLLMMVVLIIALVGCSSEETNGKDSSVNNGSNDSKSEENGSVVEKLSLGEKGTIDSTIGKYEVTVKDVEFVEEYNGNKPTRDYYVIFTVKYKNTSDHPISADDISSDARLIDDVKNEYMISMDHEEEPMLGDIEPGESIEGKIIYNHFDSKNYNLVFGNEVWSNVLEWHFSK